jgi:hypothetical protein
VSTERSALRATGVWTVRLGSNSGAERSSREDSPRTSNSLVTRGPRKDLEDQPREGQRSRRGRQPMRRYRRPWQDSEGHADCTRGSDRRGDVTDAARAGLRTLEGPSKGHGGVVKRCDDTAEPGTTLKDT